MWKETYVGVEQLKVAVMECVLNGPGGSKHDLSVRHGLGQPGIGSLHGGIGE